MFKIKVTRNVEFALSVDFQDNLPEGYEVWKRFNLPVLEKSYFFLLSIKATISAWWFHHMWEYKKAVEIH